MMQYRNTTTGAVIDVTSEIHGGDWVPVAPVSDKKKSAPRKRKAVKNGDSIRHK